MKNGESISVIIPVYNEVQLLERSVRYIDSFLATHFRDHEIIIVESGSTDGSAQVCRGLGASLSRVLVIHEGARNGFGSALRLGYSKAIKDLVWLITVDLPFSLEAIFSALPLLSQYDCVLSYRVGDKRPIYKRFRSFVYNALLKAVLGPKVKHINSAFKVFKREILQGLSLRSTGWLIDAEILYEISRRGVSYTEIPVELTDRKSGRSSVGFFTPMFLIKELADLLMTRSNCK